VGHGQLFLRLARRDAHVMQRHVRAVETRRPRRAAARPARRPTRARRCSSRLSRAGSDTRRIHGCSRSTSRTATAPRAQRT
jgi:hypothetical protein